MSISIGSEGSELHDDESSSLVPILVDLDGDGRTEIVVPDGGGVPGHVLVVLPSR
jgi:hypothetical protein